MKHQWQMCPWDENEIDIFANSEDWHNGPKCIRCGEAFCHHCTPDCYEKECEG